MTRPARAMDSPFSTINSQLPCSQSRLIYELRSFPNVRSEWDKLTIAEKRSVLDELEGDITERWALQVIKDIK